MRDITILPLTAENQSDLNRCDSAFVVEAELCLHAEDGRIIHSVRPVTPWIKRYPADQQAEAYLNRPDHAAWLAYVDGHVAGQILVAEHWNRYAFVCDLTVDLPYRRVGVGSRLIARAARWAGGRKLAGVMVETQNINVPACRFYESCGFALGGIDAQLYRGLPELAGEMALFYYLVFYRWSMTIPPAVWA
jgi:streptothricin acetyltransferase